jgi:hypothetical protein
MKKKGAEKEITISGYVIESEWDDSDDLVAVGIETDDDEEYLIEPDELGEELFDRLDRRVEVTGIVQKDKDGNMRIKVTDYRLLEDDEEDPFEEEEEFYPDEEDEDDRH